PDCELLSNPCGVVNLPLRLVHRPSLRGGIAAQVFNYRCRAVVHPILGPVTAGRHRSSVRSPEEPAVLVILFDFEPTFMHQCVVCAAEKHQVGKARLATVGPVLDVVRIDKACPSAAWESTAFVPRPQGPADRRRHGPRLASDAQGLTAGVL